MLRNNTESPNIDILFNINRMNALLTTINRTIHELEQSYISRSLETTLAALKDSINKFEAKKLDDYIRNKDNRIENLFGIIDIFNAIYDEEVLFSNLAASELSAALNEYADEMEKLREVIDNDAQLYNESEYSLEANTSSASEIDYDGWESWPGTESLFDFEIRSPTPADVDTFLMSEYGDDYAAYLPAHLLSEDEDVNVDVESLNWYFNDLFPGQDVKPDYADGSSTEIISSLEDSNTSSSEGIMYYLSEEDSASGHYASDEEEWAEEEADHFRPSPLSAFSMFRSRSETSSDSEARYSPLPARFGHGSIAE